MSAKLGSGSQRFRAFKFDIYDSVYEDCELPTVEEKRTGVAGLSIGLTSNRKKERCRRMWK